MRVFVGSLAAAAVMAAGAASAERMVIATPAELRAGPDPLYLAERGMARGTPVEVMERSGGWVVVRLPDGMQGWVPAGALARSVTVEPQAQTEPVAQTAPKPQPVDAPYATVVWPRSGTLNLRSGPGTGHDVIREMERGDWVEVHERAGPWVKLRHPSGDEGWAHNGYLTR